MMNIRGRPSDDGRANRIGRGYGEVGDPMFTITKANHHAVAQPIAFSGRMSNPHTDVDIMQTLQATNPMAVAFALQHAQIGRKEEAGPQGKGWQQDVAFTQDSRSCADAVVHAMQVRRLTPVECERLQGFPDNYTDIKAKGKPTPDGPRYKALGNSWAVPVVRWIGERIAQRLESIPAKKNP
jgi:site-specific DNA-cytosine methylase